MENPKIIRTYLFEVLTIERTNKKSVWESNVYTQKKNIEEKEGASETCVFSLYFPHNHSPKGNKITKKPPIRKPVELKGVPSEGKGLAVGAKLGAGEGRWEGADDGASVGYT